jgi:hypothetical protein
VLLHQHHITVVTTAKNAYDDEIRLLDFLSFTVLNSLLVANYISSNMSKRKTHTTRGLSVRILTEEISSITAMQMLPQGSKCKLTLTQGQWEEKMHVLKPVTRQRKITERRHHRRKGKQSELAKEPYRKVLEYMERMRQH